MRGMWGTMRVKKGCDAVVLLGEESWNSLCVRGRECVCVGRRGGSRAPDSACGCVGRVIVGCVVV
jgi:hypothetical protein